MAGVSLPNLMEVSMRSCLQTLLLGSWLFAFASAGPVGASSTDPYEAVNESWDQFGAVYQRILENYYDQLDQSAIMRAAIRGMLEELDSYSQFYDAEGLRQLRQDTSGKFAGLGITVGLKDRYPVVISPIDDTPASRAGLLPGDLIVEIEGRDTHGLDLKEVVEILRGEPGTTVAIRVRRNHNPSSQRVEIEREIIRVKSVALTAEIRPGVGYISMRHTRFSEDTASEVADALKQLQRENVNGAILDLRGNPGGLLSQATQVADLFLPKGAPIVSIREKDGRREELKRSVVRPAAAGMMLVILIDAGSASAAEIVAGAIQDNDRGIIVGTNSFGKGSVQTIFDLHETESSALKLTTALYYTPSGRSIHRQGLANSGGLPTDVPFGDVNLPIGSLLDIILRAPSKAWAETALRTRFGLEDAQIERVLSTTIGNLVGNVGVLADSPYSESASTDTGVEDEFFTSKHRRVYGGGGIAPDVVVEPGKIPHFVVAMRRGRVFFNFVVDYVASDSVLAHSALLPAIDDEVLGSFEAFAGKDSLVNVMFRRAGDRELENLRTYATGMGWSEVLNDHLSSLEVLVDQGIVGGLTDIVRPHVVAALRREFALRLIGQRASQLVGLEDDVQIEEAIRIIGNTERYEEILRTGSS